MTGIVGTTASHFSKLPPQLLIEKSIPALFGKALFRQVCRYAIDGESVAASSTFKAKLTTQKTVTSLLVCRLWTEARRDLGTIVPHMRLKGEIWTLGKPDLQFGAHKTGQQLRQERRRLILSSERGLPGSQHMQQQAR